MDRIEDVIYHDAWIAFFQREDVFDACFLIGCAITTQTLCETEGVKIQVFADARKEVVVFYVRTKMDILFSSHSFMEAYERFREEFERTKIRNMLTK